MLALFLRVWLTPSKTNSNTIFCKDFIYIYILVIIILCSLLGIVLNQLITLNMPKHSMNMNFYTCKLFSIFCLYFLLILYITLFICLMYGSFVFYSCSSNSSVFLLSVVLIEVVRLRSLTTGRKKNSCR